MTVDAHHFCITRRLRSLAAQLKVKDNIAGLVHRNLRHFLTHRQRQADPLGYRVFVRLRAAVARLVELGRLFILGLTGAPERPEVEKSIRNATLLAFSRGMSRAGEARLLDEAGSSSAAGSASPAPADAVRSSSSSRPRRAGFS